MSVFPILISYQTAVTLQSIRAVKFDVSTSNYLSYKLSSIEQKCVGSGLGFAPMNGQTHLRFHEVTCTFQINLIFDIHIILLVFFASVGKLWLPTTVQKDAIWPNHQKQ